MSNNTKKSNSKAKIYILGFVLLFVALYLYIYVVPRVSDIFVETYIAEYGTLEIVSGTFDKKLTAEKSREYFLRGSLSEREARLLRLRERVAIPRREES